MKKSLFIFLMSSLFITDHALAIEPVEGMWKLNDPSGEPIALIKLEKKGEELIGVVVKAFSDDANDPAAICKKCSGEFENKPFVGMQVVRALKKNNDREWIDGDLYVVKQDRLVKLQLQLKEDAKTIAARAYLGKPSFGRNMIWTKE
jgi:uncharacterized protein (DUF2147 family)